MGKIGWVMASWVRKSLKEESKVCWGPQGISICEKLWNRGSGGHWAAQRSVKKFAGVYMWEREAEGGRGIVCSVEGHK